MLKKLFRNLMGKTQHSPAGNEYLKKQKREEEKKAKYKRSKPKQKKEEDKKEYAYFRLKGMENKKSEDIKKLMKEFKSNKRRK